MARTVNRNVRFGGRMYGPGKGKGTAEELYAVLPYHSALLLLSAQAIGGDWHGSGQGPAADRAQRAKAKAEAIGDGFPGAERLAAAGIVRLADVPRSEEALVELPGIGKATAKKILAAFDADA
jgi:endonuclease III